MAILFKEDGNINEIELNKREAIDFIKFLESEYCRHAHAKIWCENKVSSKSIYTNIEKLAYKIGIKRHQTDMDMITKTIYYLIYKWSIK